MSDSIGFFQTVFCSSRRESKISRVSSGSSSMKPESSRTGDCLASGSLARTIISRRAVFVWDVESLAEVST